ncbi:hypothetical protein CJD36_018730 [Flavipsychrobacter stenotrophus]|uniref:Addiction module protein n=1 Tax=Flavipsychrobacter stenotrophus TaxID=2077091 RepID=A0A2S7SRW0_9BACT|nr:hypothetical protein CJD36_018730 [Flavipsychrobacter stenotrophus]
MSNSVHLNVNMSFQQLVETIKQLSPKEKLQINDALWDGDIDIPQEHQDLVLSRIEKARQDPGRLKNWDSASKKLRP